MPHYEELQGRLMQLLGSAPVAFEPVQQGFTSAIRTIARLADGKRAFVKAATDKQTADWLRAEHRVYSALRASFLPEVLAWHDDGQLPVLVLEDLSRGFQPRQWTRKRVQSVLSMLAKLRSVLVPSGLPSLESMRAHLSGWHLVAEKPELFLALGLCSERWLQRSLPSLLQAQQTAKLTGTELLHMDVRSENLCFLGKRVLLVDWNWACVGNAQLEIVHWLPNLRVAGGPPPQQILAGQGELVALMAGYWAQRAGLPAPHPGSTLRTAQLKQLQVALPWAAGLLDLPPLDRMAVAA